MRGVLALTVMFFHYGLNTAASKVTGGRIHDGVWGLSVDFFFVLSGFVICRSFIRRPVSLMGYAAKRGLRLAPIFLLTTLIAFCLNSHGWNRATIITNLLMIQSLVGLKSINFPSWSIPFEFAVPALGLLLVTQGMKLQRSHILAVVALFLVAQSATAAAYTIGQDVQWLRASTGLGLGGAMYLLRHRGTEIVGPGRLISTAAFIGALTVMAVAGVIPAAGALFPWLCAAAVWWGADSTGLFSTKLTQALGRWSYSIYMAHYPVLLASEVWFGYTAVKGWTKFTLVAAVLSFAAVAFRFVEAPLMRVGERFAKP